MLNFINVDACALGSYLILHTHTYTHTHTHTHIYSVCVCIYIYKMCVVTKFKTAICKKYGFYIKNIVVFLYHGILISCKNGIQTWETRTIINIQDIFVEWIHGCVCTHTKGLYHAYTKY